MFDWQTEEEIEWEQLPAEPVQEPAPRRWRGLVLVLAVLLLFAGGGGWLLRQTNERVEEATAVTETNILSSHRLLMDAVANQDEDLLTALFSGRDQQWVDIQLARVARGDFGNRNLFTQFSTAPLPLDAAAAQQIKITVEDDFRTAELLYPVAATVVAGEGVTETVTLLQTAVYRQGTARWLYAPLEKPFWGSRDFIELSHLTLNYPERDEEIAHEIGLTLNKQLVELCSDDYFGCDDGWRMVVRFDTRPDIWNDMGEYSYQFTPEHLFELPTPTLLGLPTDGDSKDALMQQYSVAVLTNAMSKLTEYDCCAGRNMFELLVDLQLAEMDIRPFPTESVNYDIVFNDWDDGTLRRLWGRFELEPTDRPRGVTLVRYLQSVDPDLTTILLLESIGEGYNNPSGWLADLIEPYNATQMDIAWERFVFDETAAGQIDAPLTPFPNQPLRLICQINGRTTLYEYHWRFNDWSIVWQQPLETDYLVQIRPLHDSNLQLINRYSFDDDRNRNELWLLRPDGTENFLAAYDSSDGYSFINDVHPNGRWANLYLAQFSKDVRQNTILDLDNCTEEGCEVVAELESEGNAIWSEDGRYLFIVRATQNAPSTLASAGYGNRILVADSLGQSPQFLDEHTSWPEWVGDETAVYVKAIDNSADPEIILYRTNVTTGEREAIISNRELVDLLPEGETATLYPSYVTAVSSDHTHLFLYASSRLQPFNSSSNYAFHIRFDTEPPTITPILGDNTPPFLLVEDDWHTYISSSSNNDNTTEMLLENQQTGQQYALQVEGFSFSNFWSASQEWLLFSTRNNQLTLLEPDSGYRHFISYSFGDCNVAYWGVE